MNLFTFVQIYNLIFFLLRKMDSNQVTISGQRVCGSGTGSNQEPNSKISIQKMKQSQNVSRVDLRIEPVSWEARIFQVACYRRLNTPLS